MVSHVITYPHSLIRLFAALLIFTPLLANPQALAEDEDKEPIEQEEIEEEEMGEGEYEKLLSQYRPMALQKLKMEYPIAHTYLEANKKDRMDEWEEVTRDLAEAHYYSGQDQEQADREWAQRAFKVLGLEISGYALADDIEKLMDIVQKTVCDEFGIKLEPEVKIIGDK